MQKQVRTRISTRKPLRILIAEDEPDWALALRRFYEEQLTNAKVKVAGTYSEAEAFLEDQKCRFELFSCDLNLKDPAGWSGYELLETAATSGRVNGVVVITGRQGDLTLERHVKSGHIYTTLKYSLDPWLEGLFPGHKMIVDKMPSIDETIQLLHETVSVDRLREIAGESKVRLVARLKLWEDEHGREHAAVAAGSDKARDAEFFEIVHERDVALLHSMVRFSHGGERQFKTWNEIVTICLGASVGRASSDEKRARTYVCTTMKRHFEKLGFAFDSLLIPNSGVEGYELHPHVQVENNVLGQPVPLGKEDWSKMVEAVGEAAARRYYRERGGRQQGHGNVDREAGFGDEDAALEDDDR